MVKEMVEGYTGGIQILHLLDFGKMDWKMEADFMNGQMKKYLLAM